MASARTKRPFYPVVTKVPTPGGAGTIDLPLVTLPPGTVLFRAVKLPNMVPTSYEVKERIQKKEKAVLNFYRDFLGEPLDDGTMCLLPTHNTFFYPFPFIGFGLHDIGSKFTMMVAYVLVHPVTVVCAISPSDFVRGQGQRYGPEDPWARCDIFDYKCRDLSFAEQDALHYDNCLRPQYQVESGTRGWMALADLDSIEPRKLKKQGRPGKNSPMSTYLRGLNARHPGLGKQLLSWAYKDDHQHAGFPEIALYPYFNHQGPQPLKRPCNNERVAQRLLQSEVRKNNLNYLPLAIFTHTGTYDMTTGFYDVGRLGLNTPGLFTLADQTHQLTIETNMNTWMTNAFTNGIKLPFYKEGKLALDSRTGFLILPQMVPSNMKIPLSPTIIAAEKAAIAAGAAARAEAAKAAAAAGAEKPKEPVAHDSVPYKFLCLPMDTPQATRRALQYILLFRTYLPDKFMVKYDKDKTGLRRAMIFNRPGVLGDVFKTAGIEMPKEYGKTLFEAGKLYQAETGIKPTGPKTKGAAAAGAAAGAASKLSPDVLHVTAIPPGSRIDEIRSVFERYGVESVTIDLPAAAFVRLTSPTAAAVAKATDRKVVVQGGIVNVEVATEAEARGFYTSAKGMAAVALTETAASTTPPFNYAPQSPLYGGESPVYNATGEGEGVGGAEGEEAGGAAAAAAAAPSAAAAGGPAYSPRTPEFRRTAEYRGGGGTRRRARAARGATRKHKDPLHQLGKAFASMWKLHGSSKH